MSGFKGLPPSPHEVLTMDTARLEVFTYAGIVKFYEDETKRKQAGLL